MSGIARNIAVTKSICLLFAVLLGFGLTAAKAAEEEADFYAYYTKLISGEDFEKYYQTGEYSDFVVNFNNKQRFVLQRNLSYMTYW